MAYGMADVIQRRRMIDEGNAADEIKRIERGKLNALLAICETASCRRQAILAHFGEAHARPLRRLRYLPEAGRDLGRHRGGDQGAGRDLSHRRAFRRRACDRCACSAIATKRPSAFGHVDMPVFGAGKDIAVRTWQSVYRQLMAMGLIRVDHEAFGALKLEPEARASSSVSVRSSSARIARLPSAERRRLSERSAGPGFQGRMARSSKR